MEAKGGDDKKKKMIIGGVVASLLIISIIVIAITTGGQTVVDSDEVEDLTCKNPMCGLFLTKPDFQQYTFENSDQAYEDEFWADEIFGGAITEPLMRPAAEEGGDMIPVHNTMVEGLKADYEARGELGNYWVLQNIQSGTKSFSDYWIYINDIDQEGYDLLMTINGTQDASDNRQFSKIRKYLNGYVRDIYFTTHSSPTDPTQSAENRIIYVYEGYYKNGVLEKHPNEKFGRHFLTNSLCYIGFFAQDSNEKDFPLYGKGMIINGQTDEIEDEGLFIYSTTEPQERQEIEDFNENLVPTD